MYHHILSRSTIEITVSSLPNLGLAITNSNRRKLNKYKYSLRNNPNKYNTSKEIRNNPRTPNNT